MKKALIPILIFLGVTVWGLWPESQPAVGASTTITEATLTPLIQTVQANYFAQKGYYFQALPTHTTIPTQGTPTIADLLQIPTQRAEVQTDTPRALLKLQANRDYLADFRLSINTCERGTDRGYTAVYEQLRSGVRWVKRVGTGVCSESNDWQIETLGR